MTSEDLKNIRNDEGLTQTEFAKKLGINIRTVQNWEAGSKIPKSKAMLIRNIFASNTSVESENISDNNDVFKEGEIERISYLFAKYPDKVIEIPVVDLTIREKISKEIVKITSSKEKLIEYLNS